MSRGRAPVPLTPARAAELADKHERWLAWASPAKPSSMLDEPLLARLRDHTDSGEVPADLAALDREIALARGCAVSDLPWNAPTIAPSAGRARELH